MQRQKGMKSSKDIGTNSKIQTQCLSIIESQKY